MSRILAGMGEGHAVVIGASVAGLLTARALNDRYARVTVIDRDELPAGPQSRRGVPQSKQAHALLPRGSDALDQLFPAFSAELLAAGAIRGDIQDNFSWYLDGYLLKPANSGLDGLGLSRPLIEWLIRGRVVGLAGVRILASTEVLGLVTTDDRQQVRGVRVRAGDPAQESVIAADLVVDAAGRGSRALAWLRELGYPEPPQTLVRADVTYVTRHYAREAWHLQGRNGAAMVPYPGQPRAGLVVRQEGDRFVVLLAGMLGEDPPTDDAGMLAFAETLPGPDLAEVIRTAVPLDEPVRMRYPASVRRHYEKLDRYLGGFLVTGDALCSFNPVYGQGMTVAALEALALQRLLADPGQEVGPGLFFRGMAKVVDDAWLLSVGGDLRFAEVEGRRTVIDGVVNRYLDRYRAAASVDPVLGTTFLRVANLEVSPARLLAPGHLWRVFRASRQAVAGRGGRG